MNFAVPADLEAKVKENVKINKFFDLAKELKKDWSLRVSVILIVVGALGTVLKSLERRLG